jgi:hypothetical protein
MILHDLHVPRVTVSPNETQPPLIVDADAVLPSRSPASASRRLAGGCQRSSSPDASASIRSLRRDALPRSLGKPLGIRSAQTAAVRLSAKDRITPRYVAHIGPAFNSYRLRSFASDKWHSRYVDQTASICRQCRGVATLSTNRSIAAGRPRAPDGTPGQGQARRAWEAAVVVQIGQGRAGLARASLSAPKPSN